MVVLYRLGSSLLLALFGFLLSSPSYAAYTWYTGSSTSNPASTAQSSCSAFAAVQAAAGGGSGWDGRLSQPSPNSTDPSSWNCAVFTAPAPTGQYRTAATTVRSGTAPTVCETIAGTKAGSDTNEVSIGAVAVSVIGASVGQSRNFCYLGCVASGTVTGGLKEPTGNVVLFVEGAKWTSSVCSVETPPGTGESGSTPGVQQPPTLCSSQKKCTGQVNGIDICVPCSTFAEGGSKKTDAATGAGTPASAPAGETPSVGRDSNGNPVPVGTTTREGTTKTVCEGTNCTTTTTSVKTNPDGTTSTVSEIKAGSLDDYCKVNPRSPACVTNAFGGNCASGFAATGDALASAAATALNKINCVLDPGTALDGVRAELAAGTFGPQLDNTNVNVGQFDQTNPMGNACPADVSVSMGSVASFTVPLSQMCTHLTWLGYIALAVTLISSTMFVLKGFH